MALGALDRIRQSEKLKKTAGLRKGFRAGPFSANTALGEILLEDYRLSSRKGERGEGSDSQPQ